MIILLMLIAGLFQGFRTPWRILRRFAAHWQFWILSGSIGFGGFYSLICFSADHAPGWVVATTWQLTIMASLVVLVCFGRSFSGKVWLFSGIVFLGVLVVNLSQVKLSGLKELLMGGFPVLVAAFCYPTGNQLVWEAKTGNRRLPDINHPLIENPFNKVLLLSLGSVPFWLILVAVSRPPLPSQGQLLQTGLVALFSGIIATTLFLLARNNASRASELAAVDASQSSEVIFAMLGEALFLKAALPGPAAWGGIFLVFAGLALFIGFQESGD
jgi:drug/metabolite transporter (DMT)-like permease